MRTRKPKFIQVIDVFSLCTMLYALTTTNINVVLRQLQGALLAAPDFEPIPKYRTVGSDPAKISRGKDFAPVGFVFG